MHHSFSDANACVNSRHVAYNFKVGLAINITEKSHIESNFDIDGFKMNTLLLLEQRTLLFAFLLLSKR